MNIKSPCAILLQYLVAVSVVDGVFGFPQGAGSCNGGGGVSTPHITPGQGELSNGDYSIRINGVVVSGTSELQAGKITPVELHAGSNPFKGFFFRLSGTDGTDYTDTVTVLEDETTQGFPNSVGAFCDANVGGACHTNNTAKEFVCVGLDFQDMENKEATLEITVVEGNDGGTDEWYYSTFGINVGSLDEEGDDFFACCDDYSYDNKHGRGLRKLLNKFFF